MATAIMREQGDANFWSIMEGDRWLAVVQFNGELTVERQRQIAERFADATTGAKGFAIIEGSLAPLMYAYAGSGRRYVGTVTGFATADEACQQAERRWPGELLTITMQYTPNPPRKS